MTVAETPKYVELDKEFVRVVLGGTIVEPSKEEKKAGILLIRYKPCEKDLPNTLTRNGIATAPNVSYSVGSFFNSIEKRIPDDVNLKVFKHTNLWMAQFGNAKECSDQFLGAALAKAAIEYYKK